MSVSATTPIELVNKVYATLDERVAAGRKRLGRGLTFAEKILINHLADGPSAGIERAVSYNDLDMDRVAMQDATAQMALLQFMTAGLPTAAVPSTVHCDHLVVAKTGAVSDLAAAEKTNKEVYDFLESVSAKYGIGFWGPGSGIIHQVVLEQYAFPGGTMVGTDSHTPNAGGLGMVAIGVGGAEAVDVLTGFPFNVRWPKLIGVRLTGKLDGWSSPKDVILKVAEILTVKGATGAIVEYFGSGAVSLSCTGKATICNMGAEIGATASVFAYDAAMARYLASTGRAAIAAAADSVAGNLRADDEVAASPEKYFDRVIEIDLSALRPLINGPHTPDLAREVSALGAEARANGWPLSISAALVGSCTNSSYEDIGRCASVLRDATAKGLKVRAPLFITPGSEQVRATIERDGLLAVFQAAGATVLANACGPCIGQWERSAEAVSVPNTIVSSYNRNFPKRNDGSANTLAFVASPEVVTALALAGTLDFDPVAGTLATDSGKRVGLVVPAGAELPDSGFTAGKNLFTAPPEDGSRITVKVAPGSDRLQLLEPFDPWDGGDFLDLPILLKAKGKCTTDHISMAGKWLKYRGHLENICGNLFIGAVNAFNDAVGEGKDQLDGLTKPFPEIAKHYHEAG
ncbi:MAG: aconitate hydratase, partial [Treponema sp. GWC1_61_84]